MPRIGTMVLSFASAAFAQTAMGEGAKRAFGEEKAPIRDLF
jgi:hypothetical protein